MAEVNYNVPEAIRSGATSINKSPTRTNMFKWLTSASSYVVVFRKGLDAIGWTTDQTEDYSSLTTKRVTEKPLIISEVERSKMYFIFYFNKFQFYISETIAMSIKIFIEMSNKSLKLLLSEDYINENNSGSIKQSGFSLQMDDKKLNEVEKLMFMNSNSNAVSSTIEKLARGKVESLTGNNFQTPIVKPITSLISHNYSFSYTIKLPMDEVINIDPGSCLGSELTSYSRLLAALNSSRGSAIFSHCRKLRSELSDRFSERVLGAGKSPVRLIVVHVYHVILSVIRSSKEAAQDMFYSGDITMLLLLFVGAFRLPRPI